MADFEVHPVGTERKIEVLVKALNDITDYLPGSTIQPVLIARDTLKQLGYIHEQDPIEVNSPSAIPEDQAPDEDLPMMLKPQAD